MADKSDVTVVGSCNMDLISYSSTFPKPGETLCGSKFSMGCGGKGANQCVMAAKLGASSSMISCVRLGKDKFGEMFLKTFEDLNINTTHVYVVNDGDSSTGVAQILVNGKGENCIVIVKGANDHLTKDHINQARSVLKQTKVAMFQLEIDLDVTLHALKVAKEEGCITIFNPAPAVNGLSDDFLFNTTVLICNETEAEILTGRAITSMDRCKDAILTLLEKGPEHVILTLGAKGALICGKEKDVKHVTPEKSIVPNPVIDTTGAGDCFVGSLAFFIARREELTFEEKVQRAVNIASISVGRPGTQSSYPTYEELQALLQTLPTPSKTQLFL